MNRNDPQKNANPGSARDQAAPDSRASARNAKERSERMQALSQEQQAQGRSEREAGAYDRDVPVPTNRSALGDQSTKI